jgi:hypothetical protein
MTLWDDTEHEHRAASQEVSQYALRNTHYVLNRQSS